MFNILMIEKDMRGGKSHAIHRYTTANNKYMRKHKKNKESSYITIGMNWKYLKNYLLAILNG